MNLLLLLHLSCLILSSPLLLRISPHTFAFIPIPPISLSSRNRSISKTFRHILPCVAPVYEGMHYHKTGVPWQMKSIFIMFLKLLYFLYSQGFCPFLITYGFKHILPQNKVSFHNKLPVSTHTRIKI